MAELTKSAFRSLITSVRRAGLDAWPTGSSRQKLPCGPRAKGHVLGAIATTAARLVELVATAWVGPDKLACLAMWHLTRRAAACSCGVVVLEPTNARFWAAITGTRMTAFGHNSEGRSRLG